MAEVYKTEDGWRCEKQKEHLHRAQWMDYRQPSIYLLTLVTNNRLPVLGELIGESVKCSALGTKVAQEIERIPTYHDATAIEIYKYVIMPDHIHVLLRVKERLPKHLGRYIYWFKVRCTEFYLAGKALQKSRFLGDPANRRGLNNTDVNDTANCQDLADFPASKTPDFLFAPEYHDRVLTGKNQLEHMWRYIKDNPRRLALKRANKELFRIHQDTQIQDIRCTTLGNMFLAEYPIKRVIQCSRSLTQEQVDTLKEKCLIEAQNGAVHISAVISEGEKQITRALREAGYPLIVLLHEGFPKPDNPHYKFYKPHGVYFEACAAGKLLLIEPHVESLEYEEVVRKTEAKIGQIPHSSKRYRFVAMNVIAEIMARREKHPRNQDFSGTPQIAEV